MTRRRLSSDTRMDRPLTWPAVERGTGPTVVFLHGYPLNHAMWSAQLEDLSQSYTVVLLDLPGYGLADGAQVPETLEAFAATVGSLLTARFTSPIVVVGHSFGGYVALQLYRAHPEIFRALVLTNTRSAPDSHEAKEKRLATLQRLSVPGESLDVDETVHSLVAPITWQAGGGVVETVREMVRDARTAAVRATLRAIAYRPDSTPVLSTIRVPTLIVWGEEDRLIPPPQSQSMVPLIAGSSGVGIPAAGHLPSMEAPGSFNRALQNFLSKALAS
jgi:3-oxoadipate enol-lactonase